MWILFILTILQKVVKNFKFVFPPQKSLAIRTARVKSHFRHWGRSVSFERENSNFLSLTNNIIGSHFLEYERLLMKLPIKRCLRINNMDFIFFDHPSRSCEKFQICFPAHKKLRHQNSQSKEPFYTLGPQHVF